MHVLIADQHSLVREGLKLIMNGISSNVVFTERRNMADVLPLSADRADLDLAIVDLIKPGIDGIAGLATFRSQIPDVPILVLAESGFQQVMLAAFETGAAGFIPKDLEAAAITNVIQLVLSGERYVPAEMVFKSDRSGETTDDNPLHRLSIREKEVLAKLMEGLPNKEIAKSIKVEEVTVKLHLSRIYRKFGVNNRTQAVMLARDHGWQPYVVGRDTGGVSLMRTSLRNPA